MGTHRTDRWFESIMLTLSDQVFCSNLFRKKILMPLLKSTEKTFFDQLKWNVTKLKYFVDQISRIKWIPGQPTDWLAAASSLSGMQLPGCEHHTRQVR